MSRPKRYSEARKELIREKFALLSQRLGLAFKRIAGLKLTINDQPVSEGQIYGISRGKVIPPLALIEQLLEKAERLGVAEKSAILDEWIVLLGPEGGPRALEAPVRLAGPTGPSHGSDTPFGWLEEKMGLLTAIQHVANSGDVFRLVSNRVSQEVAARDRANWLADSTLDRRILVFFRADAPIDWLDAEALLDAWATILDTDKVVKPKIIFSTVASIPGDGSLTGAISRFKTALTRRWFHHELHWYHLNEESEEADPTPDEEFTYASVLNDRDYLRETMIFGYFSLTHYYFNLNAKTVAEGLTNLLHLPEREKPFFWWTQVAKIDGPLALTLLEALGWKRQPEGELKAGARWVSQGI